MEFFSLRPRTLKIKELEARLPTFAWAIVYGLILGILFYYMNSYVFRLVLILVGIIVTKLLSRRSFSDSVLIYVFTFPLVMPIQILMWLLMDMLFVYASATDLSMYLLSTPLITFLCYKIKFYKIFNYIKTNTLLKSALFIIVLITFAFLFYINFENSLAYLTFYIIIICLIVMAFMPVMFRLYRRVEIDVARAHFIGNKIVAARNAAYLTDDVNNLRQMFDELVHHMNPEVGEKSAVINNQTDAIMALIEQKKEQRNSNIEVIADIRYYEDHYKVRLETILSFMGLLLDNAFDVETDQPIIVYTSIANHSFDLSVANEYLQTSDTDLEFIFEKGYSTKSEDGRGYGLYELKKEVENLGGRIVCFETYLEDYNEREIEAQYLIFTIQFGFDY